MNTQQIVGKILTYQNRPQVLPGSTRIPVTITLKNGNIVLKDFKLLELAGNILVGLTRQEEYTAPRENREPVVSRFRLDEIKSIEWNKYVD